LDVDVVDNRGGDGGDDGRRVSLGFVSADDDEVESGGGGCDDDEAVTGGSDTGEITRAGVVEDEVVRVGASLGVEDEGMVADSESDWDIEDDR